MTRYARAAAVDPLRQLCRVADFILLLAVLRAKKRLPAFRQLRNAAFVELGPGPTRLAFVKRLFFRRVFFVDQMDFGIPDSALRIVDLEQFANAEKIVTEVCGLSGPQTVIFFADHCLEHLSEGPLLSFLNAIARHGFLACFRVPNVLSPAGKRNFLGDATHHTSFDLEQRERIRQMGFAVFPWMRWYRPRLIFNTLMGHGSQMNQAEEIAICAYYPPSASQNAAS